MSTTQANAVHRSTPPLMLSQPVAPLENPSPEAEPQEQDGSLEPYPTKYSEAEAETEADAGKPTQGKRASVRKLLGIGKKKEGQSNAEKVDGPVPVVVSGNDQTPIVQPTRGSPPPSNYPYQQPSTPNRNLYSSSPRIVSPAGSQIFERDVQENSLVMPNSPAIPSHIQTEDHIPPVLDASSEAITSKTLSPDAVEIVMHTSHRSAALTTGVGHGTDSMEASWTEDLTPHTDKDDAASSYGALDSTDIRRLSFISFSDVVQSEHAEHTGARDAIYTAGLSSMSNVEVNRSPSPVRSPMSSPGQGTSPPTSKSASVKGVELSPIRKSLGSPMSAHHSSMMSKGGELTIETMSQALKRTESEDLSGIKTQPLSPASLDGISDRSFK